MRKGGNQGESDERKKEGKLIRGARLEKVLESRELKNMNCLRSKGRYRCSHVKLT